MNLKKNWLLPLALTVAGGAALLQGRFAPAPEPLTPAVEEIAAITEAPPQAAAERCAYVWASESAPKLSEIFLAQVKALDENAQASASYYGENCVYSDGRSEFHAMETDFYVRLPVNDLTDEETLGNWMAQVMPIVLALPREELQGNEGFVEFWFEKSESESVVARVPLRRYKNEAQGKSGAELYALFATR